MYLRFVLTLYHCYIICIVHHNKTHHVTFTKKATTICLWQFYIKMIKIYVCFFFISFHFAIITIIVTSVVSICEIISSSMPPEIVVKYDKWSCMHVYSLFLLLFFFFIFHYYYFYSLTVIASSIKHHHIQWTMNSVCPIRSRLYFPVVWKIISKSIGRTIII